MKERAVLPVRFYGDPADVCDELRRLDVFAAKVKEQETRKKGRRIRALVAVAMGRKGKKR